MKTIEIWGENRHSAYTKTVEGCRGILSRNGKILLSYQEKLDQYMIPGGGRENGESLEECCIRELMEETGTVVLPHTHFLTLEEYYHEYFFKSHYFICEYKGECNTNLTEAEKAEGMEPRWVELDEALKIFGSYPDYEKSAEMKSGMYYREYLALQEIKATEK